MRCSIPFATVRGPDRLRATAIRVAGVFSVALFVAAGTASQPLARDVLNKASEASPPTEAPQQGNWDLPLNVARVDILDRVLPDRRPAPARYRKPAATPRGAPIAFQFAAMSRDSALGVVSVSPFTSAGGRRLDAVARLYTVGTGDTFLPAGEVLVRGGTLDLAPGRYGSFVVDLEVARDAEPGLYMATVRLQTRERSVDVPFVVEVHAAMAPPRPLLSAAHWLRPRPENLVKGRAPTWWSEEHWHVIENSARTLRNFGLNTVFTPVLDGRYPLIQTIRKEDRTYCFDFSRFDRWVNLFLELGFDTFDGHPVGGRHAIETPPMVSQGGVWVRDAVTEAEEQLLADAEGSGPWLAFLPAFYEAFYAHLEETGLTRRYVQCQVDESRCPEEYGRLADLARRYLPGIKTKDAIAGQPGELAPLMDIPVFSLRAASESAGLALERWAHGQSVWLYHSSDSCPPYPTRRLDEPLVHSRLYPWLAYLVGAHGYLYRDGNLYGDAPHPPAEGIGMSYPTEDGLVPGLRMLTFREGLLDHALLALLAKRDQARADAIMRQVARSLTDYERDPAAYHGARKDLLLALDELL